MIINLYFSGVFCLYTLDAQMQALEDKFYLFHCYHQLFSDVPSSSLDCETQLNQNQSSILSIPVFQSSK